MRQAPPGYEGMSPAEAAVALMELNRTLSKEAGLVDIDGPIPGPERDFAEHFRRVLGGALTGGNGPNDRGGSGRYDRDDSNIIKFPNSDEEPPSRDVAYG